MDGFAILRRLRVSGSTTPVLLVTARSAIDDRVSGLGLGADDYLVKPFDYRELDARVQALLRRNSGHASDVLTLRRALDRSQQPARGARRPAAVAVAPGVRAARNPRQPPAAHLLEGRTAEPVVQLRQRADRECGRAIRDARAQEAAGQRRRDSHGTRNGLPDCDALTGFRRRCSAARCCSSRCVVVSGAAALSLIARYYAGVAAERAYDQLLSGAAIQVAENLYVQGGVLALNPPVAALSTLSRYDLVYYKVVDSRGVVVAGYNDLPDAASARCRAARHPVRDGALPAAAGAHRHHRAPHARGARARLGAGDGCADHACARAVDQRHEHQGLDADRADDGARDRRQRAGDPTRALARWRRSSRSSRRAIRPTCGRW